MFERKRYKLMFWIMRRITPDFNRKLRDMNLNGKIWLPHSNYISNTPRPAILFMRDYFNKGAIRGVEIGVFRGDNAKSILEELNIEMLYLVDIWEETEGYNEKYCHHKDNYKKVLKDLGDYNNIRIIKDFSKNAIKYISFVDFVYIDGDHSYKGVYGDLGIWYPKVKSKGIIAGHDIYSHKGVFPAVNDWCNERNIEFKIKAPDWWFIKKCHLL